MSNRTALTVLPLLTLLAIPVFATAAEESDSTRPTPATRQVPTVPLPPEISALLDEVLKMVNEGRRPTKPETTAVDGMLEQNKRNFLRYDEPGKVKYSMLKAWNSYFAGDDDGAVQAIQAGLRSGPEDPDMRATYAAIAIATGKYPLVVRLAPRRAPARPTRRNMEGGEEFTTETGQTVIGQGTLNFDMQAFKPQAVGRKLTKMETTYNCIGGATIDATRYDAICMLAYRAVAAKSSAPSATTSWENEGESTQSSADISGFGDLVLNYVGNGKVAFIGVSLDDAAAAYNAMKEASDRGWFWQQVMAQDAANKPLAEVAKYGVDSPTMVFLTKDGTIAYMGSPSGFLPKMLLARATDGYAAKPFVYISPTDPNARRMMAPPVDPNAGRGRPSDPNARRRTGTEEDGFQAAYDVQAETLYNHAKSFLQGTRTTTLTAGPGVQLCREILEKYGNTEYAAKARELLRDLPDEIKQRYNITNEEMGL